MEKIKNAGENAVLRTIIQYIAIAVGSLLFAVGFQLFMYPNSIASGGATGVAMIINKLSGLPVGALTIALNVPLFVLAFMNFGVKFVISSFVGMVLSSVFVDLLAMCNIAMTHDPMLACLIGGAIKGLGLGTVYYVGSTTGGTDIVAKLVRRKAPYMNLGTILLLIDAAIVLLYAFILKKYESAMYSFIAMFVVSKAIDLVLYGMDNSNVCYIISSKKDEIIERITSGKLKRGCTLLPARGAYSGKEREIIMCVIKRHQITEIRRIVRQLDDEAFFIVTEAKSVFGKGFDSITEE